jgi:large subunit ribosomal protein L22
MKAYLRSVRIAPKKANLIARMVRGLSVPVATEQLRRTQKKAARIVETLLRSAVANASHNDKQDAQMMVIKSIVVNQGQAYHRGMPMARGRQRPFRKFLSHITLTLGLPGEKEDTSQKKSKKSKASKNGEENETKQQKTASQKGKVRVKQSGSKEKKTPSSSSSISSSSSTSS